MASSLRKRPPAVTIVGCLFILLAPISALNGLAEVLNLFVTDPDNPLAWSWSPLYSLDFDTLQTLASIGFAFLGSILDVLIGVGLLGLRSRAWLWAMILLGISLTQNLISYWANAPDFISMTADTFLVLLLNQTEVQEAFKK